MPIKLPRGFARRKSSGNALEDVQPTSTESSFRVLERPHTGSKSFDGLRNMPVAHGKTKSVDDPYPDNIFAGIEKPAPATNRGVGSTNNSTSAGRLYDSSSSAKYSSSSTLPSSTDVSAHEVPIPPIPESPFASFRAAAGRTFSFGSSKTPKAPPPVQIPMPRAEPPTQPQFQESHAFRPPDRVMTAPNPPRLLEPDVRVGGESDWGNMFDDPNKPKNSHPNKESSYNSRPQAPPKDKRKTLPSLLAPLRLDRSKKPEPSPTSDDSRDSRDELMAQMSPQDFAPPATRHLTAGHNTANARSGSPYSRQNGEDMQSHMLVPPEARKDPEAFSIYGSDNDFTHVPLNRQASEERMPLAKSRSPPINEFESSLSAEASIAARYEEVASADARKPNKVMTPAQFERYKEHRELTRLENNAESSDSDRDSDEYEEDDDEEEKKKQAINQRKKQEAHLSVYRQQMMKVTGEQKPTPSWDGGRNPLDRGGNNARGSGTPTPPPLPGTDRRSMSMSLSLSAPGQEKMTNGGKSSEGSDDEDVPLGILAAHGFPNRARPPSQLMKSSSNPNLRASLQPSYARPGSRGAEQGGRRTLPPFARNLPKDPYLGAGLVNQPNREAPGMRGPGSTMGDVPPGLPPGGLVGIIAAEERARAMRRGSPNTQAGFDMPHNPMVGGPGTLLGQQQQRASFMPPHPQQMDMQMPMMGDPAQAQAQASQMAQMMQMQMQWMQQMMQMQGLPMGQPPQQQQLLHPQTPPPMMNGGFLQPPGMGQRPVSMVSNGNNLHLNGGAPRQVDPRTLGMLDPTMAMQQNRMSYLPPVQSFGNGHLNGPSPGYTPSIAPSERSNVGNASRYRPVSMAPPQQRSSTFTSSTLLPWGDDARRGSLSSPNLNNLVKPATTTPTPPPTLTVRPVSHLRARNTAPAASSGLRNSIVDANKNNDDDDDGWEDMMKNREKRKTGWKFKRGTSTFGDLFHGNHDQI